MSQKKVNNQKLKYAVIIAECLNADYDTASVACISHRHSSNSVFVPPWI